MNLNLGLESLNRVNSAVVPFTPASAIEMQNASEAITNLMSSLEGFYDAARNAMLVKKAVKKYGKTQSIVALIGQEGLAAAQSFSMEGFWEKVKNFLIKIWEKIKEWWGRFWGMFFSVENKLSSFESSLSGSKRLQHPAEFDAPVEKVVTDMDTSVRNAVSTLKACLDNPTDANMQSKVQALVSNHADTTQNGGLVSASGMGFGEQHYKLATVPEVKALASKLLKIIKDYKTLKKDIDEYTKKALDKIKSMKITVNGNSGDAFGRNAATGASDRAATSDEQDIATKIFKHAAKLNNQLVAAVVKAATQIAVKLMAHTRLVD